MKKIGFTLAEILIVLSIIGVVASITIPALISDNKDKVSASKLSSTITVVENAFSQMMINENAQTFDETNFEETPNANTLGNYLKLTNGDYDWANYSGANTVSENLGDTAELKLFQIKNGALLIWSPDFKSETEANVINSGGTITEAVAKLAIDINASESPNVWGRDIFLFAVGNDGVLYPACGIDYNNIYDENLVCPGAGCTARLIQNNFVVNY